MTKFDLNLQLCSLSGRGPQEEVLVIVAMRPQSAWCPDAQRWFQALLQTTQWQCATHTHSLPEEAEHEHDKRWATTHCRSMTSAGIWCWFQRSLSPAGWSWLQLPVELFQQQLGPAGSGCCHLSPNAVRDPETCTALHVVLCAVLCYQPSVARSLPPSALSQHLSLLLSLKLWQAVGGSASSL